MEALLNVLSTEWQHRFDEKLFHMGRYHRQGDILKGFIALLVGAAGFALSNEDARKWFLSPAAATDEARIAVLGVIVTLVLIAQYQLFSILDSFVLIFRNAHRIAAIEIQINELVAYDATLWDSKVSPAFYEPKSKWEFPRRFDQLAPFTLLVILIALHAVFVWTLARFWPHHLLAIIIPFAALTLVNLIQFIWIGFFSLDHIRNQTFKDSVDKQNSRIWVPGSD